MIAQMETSYLSIHDGLKTACYTLTIGVRELDDGRFIADADGVESRPARDEDEAIAEVLRMLGGER